MTNDELDFNESGRSFQSLGPNGLNAREPNEVKVRGTKRGGLQELLVLYVDL